MKFEEEQKEIEKLKNAKLREYTVDTFKKYWTSVDDYENKEARIVNASYIVVYSVWHKRLLARIFYFEEYIKYKKIKRELFEVQRQVAGMSVKIIQRLYNSTFAGFKACTGAGEYKWNVANAKKYKIYGIIDNWNGEQVIGFTEYNDPIKYLKKSIQKYCAYECFPEKEQEHNHMFEYLLKYERHPELEMLLKMGLSNLTYDLTPIRRSKKGIDMLGITKSELCYLQAGINLRAYRKIRNECIKYKLSVKEAEKAYEIKTSKCGLDCNAKLIRYLADKHLDVGMYADYIKMKEEIGLPNENKYLYPKNFEEAHGEVLNRIKIKKSEIIARKMLEITAKAKNRCISDGIYKMIVLNSPDDLIKEGKMMHHCVGTYAEKVAKGDCLIYSVRKNEKMDEPLATIELCDKRIVQVRAAHNEVPNEEISNFVRKWESKFRLSGW